MDNYSRLKMLLFLLYSIPLINMSELTVHEHQEDMLAKARQMEVEQVLSAFIKKSETEGEERKNIHQPLFYRLYNNKNKPSEYVQIEEGELKEDLFLKGKPLKILVHGFQANINSAFPQEAKNAYLSKNEDSNIICMDWSKQAMDGEAFFFAPLFYKLASENVRVVGLRLANFLLQLKEKNIVSDFSSVHLIGFSLGAHICGLAGHELKMRNATIGRITGLDPAGPLFTMLPTQKRLDEEDATYVDIIHTNMGELGFYGEAGNADFYPNGGAQQPSCVHQTGKFSKGSLLSLVIEGACSHKKAATYFIKSITEQTMKACKCNSYEHYKTSCNETCNENSIVGEFSSLKSQGRYYFQI